MKIVYFFSKKIEKPRKITLKTMDSEVAHALNQADTINFAFRRLLFKVLLTEMLSAESAKRQQLLEYSY